MARLMYLVIVGILAAGVGCGGGVTKPKLYPVSGEVTVAGKPLADCGIQFISTKSPTLAFAGTLDSDGQYTLADREDGRPGAEPGMYKVILQPSMEAAKKAMMAGGQTGPTTGPPDAGFPVEFSQAATSPKEVEVKAESNTIDIEIP